MLLVDTYFRAYVILAAPLHKLLIEVLYLFLGKNDKLYKIFSILKVIVKGLRSIIILSQSVC